MLKDLLVKFFEKLEYLEIEYCVIGNYHDLPEYTSNDVDIWVANHSESEDVLQKIAKDVGLKLYMQNMTANGSNNYFYSYSEGSAIDIVKIDLMTETAYRSVVPIVNSELIKENRMKFKNFYVSNEILEGVMHLFYPLVTFGQVKEKYKNKLLKLISVEEFKVYVKSIAGEKHFKLLDKAIREENWMAVEAMAPSIKRHLILKMLLGMNVSRLMVIVKFIYYLFYRMKNKNGIFISFTGIDGAGKTSIKEYIVENSNKYFTKNRCKEYYWRPFFLPRISDALGAKGQVENIDESGKRILKTSFFVQVKNHIKYIYYSSDFIIGKMKYYRCIHTGGVAIFDRYHFDNIIYPERFGFKISKKVMRVFDKYIIPQPDILFYFNAETHVLYERKHEIDIDEITSQKKLYAEEMKRRKDIIEISTDGTFENSVREVLLKCLDVMSSRYKT